MSMKTLISSAALIAGMATITPAATAADWSLSADFVGEYVFRGTTLGAEAIQTAAEVSFDNGVTAGIWGSVGVGEQSLATADEIDFYVGYGFDLSETVGADIGATLYHYPQLGDILDVGDNLGGGDASTLEIYGGLSFDAAVEPSVYVYYDTTLEVFTVEGSAGYSFPTGEATSLDLSGTIGAVEPDSGSGYQYGQLGAALSYAFSDAASGYVGLTGVVSSEDTFYDTDNLIPVFDEDNTVFYSIGLSTGF